jgi:hypothetical protein
MFWILKGGGTDIVSLHHTKKCFPSTGKSINVCCIGSNDP